MATYRGNEVPVPDRLDADLMLVGKKLGGLENVEEELNLPPSAEPDALRRPGQKGYMETQPMATSSRDNDMLAYARGAARQIRQGGPQPGGALGNTADGRPDFDKGELPSNMTRPAFAQGGMVKHGSSTHVTCNKKG